jgi:pimeloyl-ACP methyl ester carboxylesterase
MFGHGTGGEFRDTAFDEELAQENIAKVGVQFYGWGKDDALATFLSLKKMFVGTQASTAWLMQAVADGAAVQAAMTRVLGDVLAGADLGGAPNLAAGRRPDGSIALWAGGSLGGTMGLVFTAANPEVRAAVLNVPGAGWTHFIPYSILYDRIVPFIRTGYGYDLSVLQALFMSQSNWDDVDGGVWKEAIAARKVAFLDQQSIGDPVLPNPGTENVARATGAVQLGAVLAKVEGVEALPVSSGAEIVDGSGFTQYRVKDGASDYDVHGFAARDTPAGAAAREQIRAFVASVFAGRPRITLPVGCADGSCDFRE